MDCFILHAVLLALLLLFTIIIICYHYAKYRSKQKKYCRTNNIKIENNDLRKVSVENFTCYYFNDLIKFEDFDFDIIFLDERHTKIF